MADDPSDGYVLLFGDQSAGSYVYSWAFENGTWRNLSPAHSPPSASYNGMVYDAADSEVVIFGVEAPSWPTYELMNETWAFHAGDWTRLDTPVAPPGLTRGLLAYNAGDHEVLFFGGANQSQNGPWLNDTWAFQGGLWTNITASAGATPPPRAGFGMSSDPSSGGTVLFGGQVIRSPSIGYLANDTWTFDHGSWTNVTRTAGPAPSPRWLTAMADDPSASAALLFGGSWGSGTNDYPPGGSDTWEFRNGTWTNVTPVLSPPARYQMALSYDASTGTVLLTGGCTWSCEGQVFNDTWLFGAGPLWGTVSFAPRAAVVGASIQFSAIVTGGLPPYSFNWSFGDGSPNATGVVASHRFSSAGNYTVTFQVTDAKGSSWNTSVVCAVAAIQPLTASLSIGQAQLLVGQPTTLTASAVGGVAPYSYWWKFGDGTSETTSYDQTSHSYAAPGSFTISVAVNDSGLDQVFLTGLVNVSLTPLPFTVTIAADRTSGPPPLTVKLTALVSNGTVPEGYVWSFGDGSPQLATPTVTHTFLADGIYDVQASVKDVAGEAVTASVTISVETPTAGNAPLWVQLVLHAGSNLPGSPVSFDAVATGGVAPYSYLWPGVPSTCVGGPSSSLNCTLPPFGTLVVSVVVTDWDGTTATGLSSVSVQPSAPHVAPSNVSVNSTVEVPLLIWVSLGAALAVSTAALGVAVVSALTDRRPRS